MALRKRRACSMPHTQTHTPHTTHTYARTHACTQTQEEHGSGGHIHRLDTFINVPAHQGGRENAATGVFTNMDFLPTYPLPTVVLFYIPM